MLRHLPLLPLLAGCAAPLALPPPQPAPWPERPSLDADLQEIMARRGVAALSACALERGEVVWCQAYGWADVALGTPATTEALFDLASVSKLFTAAGVLMAAEEGLVSLDAPAPLALPEEAGGPSLRQLLTHTAGFEDDIDRILDHSDASVEPELARFVEPALSDPDLLSGCAPGARWDYSNTGFAAAAWVVEQAGGEPFIRHLEERLLAPLGLRVTPTPEDDALVARRYPDTRRWTPGEVERSDLYPAGWLYADAPSVARFLEAVLSSERFDARPMLRPETEADDFGILPINAQGLGAARYTLSGERGLWGHMGNNRGGHSLVLVDPERGDGVVLLSTGVAEGGARAWFALKELAERALEGP